MMGLRVAYVCADPGVPVFGRKGCTVHVQEVLRALLAAGARVDLFATRFDGDSPADLSAVRVHRLPGAPKGDPAVRERLCIDANAATLEELRRVGPFDFVYERYSLWGYAGMEYARESGVAGVLEVNAPLVEEHATYRELVHRDEAAQIAQRAFAAASVLAAVSTGVARYLEGHAAARGRVHVVPNGVNPRRFSPEVAAASPARPGTFTVGFCGNLKPWHGIPVLLDAFERLHARHADTRLLVVGEGPERETIERRRVESGLGDAIEMTGRVSADQVPGLLTSMDVATAPYPATEGFYFSPLKLFEYMAAGVPVVGSRIGQVAEVLRDGETGILCPPGDAVALAAALERVMFDGGLRRALAASAREQVLRDHTWEAVVARVLSLAGVSAGAAAGRTFEEVIS
jgi:glycosyltransferase involved in cell wall biosynthesis